MEWISIKEQMPPEYNEDNDNNEEYLFLFKDHWNEKELHIVVGTYNHKRESTEEYEETLYNGGIRKVVEEVPERQWIDANCSLGKCCDEAEIDFEQVTHWSKLPEMPE